MTDMGGATEFWLIMRLAGTAVALGLPMDKFSHVDWQVRPTASAARRDLYGVTPGSEHLIASVVAEEDADNSRFEEAMGPVQAALIMHATIEIALKALTEPVYESDPALAQITKLLQDALRHGSDAGDPYTSQVRASDLICCEACTNQKSIA